MIQNKVLRCLVKRYEGTSWDVLAHMGAGELSRRTDILTVIQMTALSILTVTHRMLEKPAYIVDRMRLSIIRPTSHQLKLTSKGFMEKAASIWNSIPAGLRKEPS